MIQDPNQFEGTDTQRIQQAIDAAAAGDGRVMIPRINRGKQAASDRRWLLDEAIRLPGNITVELAGCHLKLSDRCRDNFFRSANCGLGIDPIQPLENIHLVGSGGATLEGADRPRSTGDGAKILGERTFGTDAGVAGEHPRGDWRNIGVLMACVEGLSIQGLRFVDSHAWAISLEHCGHGILRDLDFRSAGFKMIDGRKETILNQDGLDLRQGCHDFLIENITGATGDDLIALTAIPRQQTQSGLIESTMVSGHIENPWPGIHHVIIRNVRGHCAGGHHIVRLLNTGGLPMEHIVVDGVIDTSLAPQRSRVAVKIGDKFPAYGGINPLGTTRQVLVQNVISRCRDAVLIGGSLCESSISHVLQQADGQAVNFESGPEYVRDVVVTDARTCGADVPASSLASL